MRAKAISVPELEPELLALVLLGRKLVSEEIVELFFELPTEPPTNLSSRRTRTAGRSEFGGSAGT